MKTSDIMPPRSRLYSLPLLGKGLATIECLTSYINRLGWLYRVRPSTLVWQEIAPHLTQIPHLESARYKCLANYARCAAQKLNGAGQSAIDATNILMTLTMRSDLRNATALSFYRGFSKINLLRPHPAWCAACYHEWKVADSTVYQPLIWMLTEITVCPHHHRPLQERCPYCHEAQSLIVRNTKPGFCTQCARWLGAHPRLAIKDEATLDHLGWTVHVLEELCSLPAAHSLTAERLNALFATCLEASGGYHQLSRVVNLSRITLQRWSSCRNVPELKSILTFCYAVGISPVQFMTEDVLTIRQHIKQAPVRIRTKKKLFRPSAPVREQVRMTLQAMLDGQTPPSSVSAIGRRFGLGIHRIRKWFPGEAKAVSRRYQAYLIARTRQRVDRECEEVRQLTHAFYVQGKFPGGVAFTKMLSNPGMLREPVVIRAWHAYRRELGVEQ